jgi:predicted enzyme related to lactoylglutathione lyase
MTDHAGRFIWYELMTTDTDAAGAFYRSVVGWDVSPFGGDGGYWILSADGRGAGGMMALPPEACAAGARPGWIGYIATPDVDAAADRLTAAGGAVHKAPQDIPGVGRFAIVADPQGAAFCLMTPQGEGDPLPPPGRPGSVDWHELHTGDQAAAFDFYAGQFGWAKASALDMGPMGTYQLFRSRPADADAVGGMMTNPNVPRPAWLFYVDVPDIDAAHDRILAGGGKVLVGPHEVPGGGMVQALDPQGAMFAVVGNRA